MSKLNKYVVAHERRRLIRAWISVCGVRKGDGHVILQEAFDSFIRVVHPEDKVWVTGMCTQSFGRLLRQVSKFGSKCVWWNGRSTRVITNVRVAGLTSV